MHLPSAVELQAFYETSLGQLATQALRRSITKLWPQAKGETMLAIGYGLPLLRPYLKSADVLAAALDTSQGAVAWPPQQANHSVLTNVTKMPFHDNTVNRILVMHALEYAQPAKSLLQEVERLLTPSGRAIFIVPNRRSLWVRAEQTPFATGHPYSMFQLETLLKKQGFNILRETEALFFPPFKTHQFFKFSRWIEKIGRSYLPLFGGVLIIEVEKCKTERLKGKPVPRLNAATEIVPTPITSP